MRLKALLDVFKWIVQTWFTKVYSKLLNLTTKACLILHLIVAARNIYLVHRERSRESQYKVHIIGFFCPQQCAHTLKGPPPFIWFWLLLSDLLHTMKRSQEAAHNGDCSALDNVCMLQYLILSILKQGNWASFTLTLKKKESNFVFWIHLLKICSLPALTPLGSQFVLHSLEYFNKICNSNQRWCFSWCWAVTQLLNSRCFLPVLLNSALKAQTHSCSISLHPRTSAVLPLACVVYFTYSSALHLQTVTC